MEDGRPFVTDAEERAQRDRDELEHAHAEEMRPYAEPWDPGDTKPDFGHYAAVDALRWFSAKGNLEDYSDDIQAYWLCHHLRALLGTSRWKDVVARLDREA